MEQMSHNILLLELSKDLKARNNMEQLNNYTNKRHFEGPNAGRVLCLQVSHFRFDRGLILVPGEGFFW